MWGHYALMGQGAGCLVALLWLCCALSPRDPSFLMFLQAVALVERYPLTMGGVTWWATLQLPYNLSGTTVCPGA
jgi:hypothetical protein